MSKKLLSLVFVLALAGMASAIQWTGATSTDARGNWNVATNWDTPASMPLASTDRTTIMRFDANRTTGTKVLVDSLINAGGKVQAKNQVADLLIASTGSIYNDQSVQVGTGTDRGTTIQIDAGGVWDACRREATSLANFEFGTAQGAYVDTLNIYGTLNVKSTRPVIAGTSSFTLAPSTGTGIARVTVGDGGLLNVDVYTINSALVASGTYVNQLRGKITIESGGLMKILGDKSAQVNADILAGTIVGPSGVKAWVVTEGKTVYTYVPEPATIALLGLGSLTLLRRKR